MNLTTKQLLDKAREQVLDLAVELDTCSKKPDLMQHSDTVILLMRAREVNSNLQQLECNLRSNENKLCQTTKT